MMRKIMGSVAVLLVSIAAIYGYVCLLQFASRQPSYMLVSPALPGPMLVTEVRHMGDGALCFHDIRGGKDGCLKLPQYMLIEQSVQ
jgi:hypothetical protein